jgi:hypothetical protein
MTPKFLNNYGNQLMDNLKEIKQKPEKTYSEQEVIDLLTMQRENCYVAILGETRNEEIATIALNAPEPGGRNGSWKNNKL